MDDGGIALCGPIPILKLHRQLLWKDVTSDDAQRGILAEGHPPQGPIVICATDQRHAAAGGIAKIVRVQFIGMVDNEDSDITFLGEFGQGSRWCVILGITIAIVFAWW